MILSFAVQETCILSPALLPLREEREGVGGQRSAGESGVLVDFPAMPDVMQVDSPLARIKFVKHPVVAHAQFELGTALQPLVGENVQPGSQVVHFTFHIGLNLIGQGVESAGKGGGPDLQGSSHGSPGVAGSEFTGRNFTAGFIEPGNYLIGQFEVVFHIVLEPTMKLRQFIRRELRNGSFNFLNRAHKKKDSRSLISWRPQVTSAARVKENCFLLSFITTS